MPELKRLSLFLSFVIISLQFSLSAQQIEVIEDDIVYLIDKSEGTATCHAPYNSDIQKTDLIIPDSVIYEGKSYPVTSISDYAFHDCLGLQGSLTIGNSVIRIGDFAFNGCSGFTGMLIIPDSVITIGYGAFRECSGFTGSLTIPDSVTEIGEFAFLYCSGFTDSLIIGDRVTEIGDGAFAGCSGFNGSLKIPDSVIKLGEFAFSECSGFNGSLIIPDSVIRIGDSAFSTCTGFTGSLIIPDSVTEIGEYAFYDCSGFTGSLIIPDTVFEIGEFAFAYCSGFTGSLIIPDSVISIGDFAFRGCSGFNGSLTIGDTVTTIGDFAFEYTLFTEVFSYNTTPPYAGESTFSSFIKYSPLYVPMESVGLYEKTDGWKEFNRIYAIGEEPGDIMRFKYDGIWYTIISEEEKTVKTLEDGYLYGHQDLTGSLIIPSTVEYHGDIYTVVEIGEYSFYVCGNLTGELKLPDYVTEIGEFAFAYCSGFTGSLIIPDSEIRIGDAAFGACSGFTGSLTIGDSVTEIGYEAFAYCSGFTGSLTIGDSVTEIGEYAFYGCSGFKESLIIGESVTTIGKNAFSNTQFAEIYSFNPTPPIAYQSTFPSFIKSSPLFVPLESIELYEKAEGWEEFNRIYAIGEAVDGMDFKYEGIYYTIISAAEKTVKTLEDGYLYGHQDLTGSLIIPSTVEYHGDIYTVVEIGNRSFYKCWNLTGELKLPDSVTKIGASSFGQCWNLRGELKLTNSVAEIGYGAFAYCTGFTGSLTIGDSVTEIGETAFYGTGFTVIISYNSTPPLAYQSTFYSISNTPLYVPSESKGLYEKAEGWKEFNKIYGIGTEPDTMSFEYDGIWYTIISEEEKTVKTLEDGYLYGHQDLTGSLIIPSTVEYRGDIYTVVEIGDYSFYECENLTGELKLPDSVTSIGDFAFYYCSGFKGSLIIPDSVTEIGEDAFAYCFGFTGSLTLGDSVTEIGYEAFAHCPGFTGSLTIPDSVTEIGIYAFIGCSGFTGSLTIGNSVTEIGYGAFTYCSGFTGSLTIGDSVTEIGEYAFAYCSGFTGSLIIPDSVIRIGDAAFGACSGFTDSLTIGDSVTEIGYEAFAYCSEFTGSLTIGKSVTEIGEYAFANTGFTEVFSFNPKPPLAEENTFYSINDSPLYVPSESISLYEEAPGWETFFTIKDLESGGIVKVETIEITPSVLELVMGKSFTLTAKVYPDNATFRELIWESSSPEVATVSEEGMLTALSEGTAVITVRIAEYDLEASCQVYVKAEVIEVEKIELNEESNEMEIGETITLTATIIPSDATNQELTWRSDNTEVVTVDNCVVMAVGIGRATVTATASNGVSVSCEVSVNPVEVSKVVFDTTSSALTIGESIMIRATVYPENATYPELTWTSSNTDVATVSEGMVYALGKGTATIKAQTTNDVSAICAVTVVPPVATAVTLTPDGGTIKVDQSLQLKANLTPANAETILTWSSDNTNVATVSTTGLVTGKSVGTANIEVRTAEGITAVCLVKVETNVIEVSSVTLDKTSYSGMEGTSVQLKATVSPENATDKTVTWTSSNPEVATVSTTGLVSLIGRGMATITAASGNVTAKCEVTVESNEIAATGITVSPATVQVKVGENVTIAATVAPENATDKTVTWTSSDVKTAIVSTGGTVTGVSPGKVTITAMTHNGLIATSEVTVWEDQPSDVEVTSVQLNSQEVTLREGDVFLLTAKVYPENATDKEVTWTTTDEEVASVSNGKVTALSTGYATVTATATNGVNASCDFIVLERPVETVPVEQIILSETAVSATEGYEFTLTATVYPENATDKSLYWSSDDTSVVTVNSYGECRITGEGNAVITVSAQDGSGVSAQCMVIGYSGIEEILASESGNWYIITLNGETIRKNVDADLIKNLAKGVYILTNGNTSVKVYLNR